MDDSSSLRVKGIVTSQRVHTTRIFLFSQKPSQKCSRKVPAQQRPAGAKVQIKKFEWLGLKKKDELPRLVAGKYLKQLLRAHEAADTLHISRDELHGLCEGCPVPGICEEWDSVGKLICFCLESILPKVL